jgi:hypothetical protein
MSGPNAFSMRRAISEDRDALPARRSDKVARRTLRMSAALDTLKPSNLSERVVEHEKEEFRFGFSRVAGSGQSESARLVPVLLKLPWQAVDVVADVLGEIMSRIDKERIRKVS